MKKIAVDLLWSKESQPLKKIARKIREVLVGKKFDPIPSYWAMVPVKKQLNKFNKEY